MARGSQTGHCIPSELSIQWRDEREDYVPSKRREKKQRMELEGQKSRPPNRE